MNITGLVRLVAGSGADGVTSGDVSFTIPQTGENQQKFTQVIGTTLEQVVIHPDIIGASPQLPNIGMLAVANLDDTNYVELSYAGVDDSTFNAAKFARIKPKSVNLISPTDMTSKTQIYARANVAAVRIAVTAVQA